MSWRSGFSTKYLLGILLLILSGCPAKSPDNLPMVDTTIGNQVFHLEVASTDPQREKGLMRRDSLPADQGMIFVFDQDQNSPFWMKDTRIPLDILFVNSARKVVSIQQMKPYDLSPVKPDEAYRWAIELNKNAAETAGAKVGDVLELPPEVKK